eukprot:scaffold4841_cov132-Cylindrotheca_fusiformis.AAC.12
MDQDGYRPMESCRENHEVSNFDSWDSEQLGLFFRRKGLGEYCGALKKHKITGRIEIGIDVVGDRLMFRHHLKDLSRKDRFNKRMQALWQGTEQIFFSDHDRAFWTCGGLFPIDPSTYSLSTNHLRVRKVQPVRCGPVRLCCFGAYYYSNNIDLSKVDDVDVIGIPAPCFQKTCCCAKGKDRIEVESRFEKGGKVSIILEEGQGDIVAAMILNQVEESQKMERGSF